MYEYRKWTVEQKQTALNERLAHSYPLHSPPHISNPDSFRIITGACFEHKAILNTDDRICWFEQELLKHLEQEGFEVTAWVVLPNHYHILAKVDDIERFARSQGQLHGRTSHAMNQQDGRRGRQVWYRCSDRIMRSERHFFTTLNYIHNNPVKHGHCRKWGEWIASSFHWYLENKGREWLIDVWQEYPVLEYGKGWDDSVVDNS